jgi:LPS O-antigen subunit length determinant protein (WzzB/FepE family)
MEISRIIVGIITGLIGIVFGFYIVLCDLQFY